MKDQRGVLAAGVTKYPRPAVRLEVFSAEGMEFLGEVRHEQRKQSKSECGSDVQTADQHVV